MIDDVMSANKFYILKKSYQVSLVCSMKHRTIPSYSSNIMNLFVIQSNLDIHKAIAV